MTISYPREMPSVGGINGQSFEIQRIDYLSPELNGQIGAVSAGFPIWVATWNLQAALTEASSGVWRAWVSSLRGPMRRFYGMDLTRRLPLKYPAGFGGLARAGGGSFPGSATSWSVDETGSVLTLYGLPAGFALSAGDMIGFRWGASPQRRTCVRALEPLSASSSGALTVEIEPALPFIVPPTAVAYLQDAACLMRLTPETRIGDMDLNRSVPGSIVAIQDLMP
jgi:hypothetical protein